MTQAYTHIAVQKDFGFTVVIAVDESTIIGLDIETTGLDPFNDRARLLQLDCDTNDGGRTVYVIDLWAVNPAKLWPVLAEKSLIVFNATFDLGFLARLGFAPTKPVIDPMNLSRLTAPDADRFGKGLPLALRELRVEAVALHNEARLVTDVNVLTLFRLLLDT